MDHDIATITQLSCGTLISNDICIPGTTGCENWKRIIPSRRMHDAQVVLSQRNVKVLDWVSLPLNVARNDMFGFGSANINDGYDMLSMITKLKNAIQGGDVDTINGQIANIDKNYDNILTWSARLGSLSTRMDGATTTLEDSKVRLQKMISDTEDIDLTTAIVELKTHDNGYEVAVSLTQRILQILGCLKVRDNSRETRPLFSSFPPYALGTMQLIA